MFGYTCAFFIRDARELLGMDADVATAMYILYGEDRCLEFVNNSRKHAAN